MNLKVIFLGVGIGVISFLVVYGVFSQNDLAVDDIKYFEFNIKTEGVDLIEVDEDFAFSTYAVKGEYIEQETTRFYGKFLFGLKDENESIYNQLKVDETEQKTIVIYSIFTASAYDEPGFYNYYRNECDSTCLTTKVKPLLRTEMGGNAAQLLKLLGYKFLSDIDIDKNPKILEKFDKVILLHNEYVTKNEFEAITNHPKVIYLYPNALYAEVAVNYDENTITLIRGHNYPEEQIRNGFGWKNDNSELEYNTECKDWEFYKVENGWMLNCYPEQIIYRDIAILKVVKEL